MCRAARASCRSEMCPRQRKFTVDKNRKCEASSKRPLGLECGASRGRGMPGLWKGSGVCDVFRYSYLIIPADGGAGSSPSTVPLPPTSWLRPWRRSRRRPPRVPPSCDACGGGESGQADELWKSQFRPVMLPAFVDFRTCFWRMARDSEKLGRFVAAVQ